jgi:hypothetical protein
LLIYIAQIVMCVYGIVWVNDETPVCEATNQFALARIVAYGYVVFVPLAVVVILLPFASHFCANMNDDCGCKCMMCLICPCIYLPWVLCDDDEQTNREKRYQQGRGRGCGGGAYPGGNDHSNGQSGPYQVGVITLLSYLSLLFYSFRVLPLLTR